MGTPTAWSPASPASSTQVLEEVLHVFDRAPEDGAVGMTAVLRQGPHLFIADTTVTRMPEAEELVEIAIARRRASRAAWGWSRAWPSCPTRPSATRSASAPIKMREAVAVLDAARRRLRVRGRDAAGRGAEHAERRGAYPFMRLTGPANVLVMPAIHSASICVKLMQEMAGADGDRPDPDRRRPQPIQLCSTTSVTDILNMAVLAACNVGAA